MTDSSTVPRVPLSPASPPEQGLKQTKKPNNDSDDNNTAALPHTPPSESMSVAIKRWASSYSDGSHTNENMANTSSADYMPQSHKSVADTPASQATSARFEDKQSQQRQSSMLKRAAPHDNDDHEQQDYENAAHKRLRKDDSLGASSLSETSPALPKAGKIEEDSAHPTAALDQEKPKLQIQTPQPVSESAKPAVDLDMHDVGPAFRLGRSILKRPKVDVTRSLLGDFGLHPLLSQVARHDPKTNEKINKLRKSYEGQIKIAKLPGKLGSYKQERNVDANEPSKLRLLGVVSEEDFVAQHPDRAIGDFSGLHEQVQKALRINPGIMPDRVAKIWDEVLGHDAKPQPPATLSAQPSFGQSSSARVSNSLRVPQTSGNAMQERNTRKKKRSYQDESFAGYSGFGDGNSEPEIDHDIDTDYADRHGKRRRKD